MRTIWKFPIFAGSGEFSVKMPGGAKLLDVQTQFDQPCIWALVESETPEVDHRFVIQGTGFNVGLLGKSQYVGTFQIAGGSLVFHLFDLGES